PRDAGRIRVDPSSCLVLRPAEILFDPSSQKIQAHPPGARRERAQLLETESEHARGAHVAGGELVIAHRHLDQRDEEVPAAVLLHLVQELFERLVRLEELSVVEERDALMEDVAIGVAQRAVSYRTTLRIDSPA